MPKKPPADPQSCASCRFFQPNQQNDYGYCRRFPPVVASTEEGAVSIQPSTVAHEWCGEFARITH